MQPTVFMLHTSGSVCIPSKALACCFVFFVSNIRSLLFVFLSFLSLLDFGSKSPCIRLDSMSTQMSRDALSFRRDNSSTNE
ncbi:hypothetical protein K491DRAFT_84187 [Lophiostoma macrostomum CBS 122681]|uniref:Uncharacterized protein n=1 Tax=Lophiostoma macrostomum CBS 122681 TaxID=1314788 RepID=A0A6A6SVA2_9PLEO|nr:hypothetical protein K491DRAFT_84187 [Lophiostoma macrostomum CBS 122681]